MEPMHGIARAINHGQSQYRSGQFAVAQDSLFDGDFVILIINPGIDSGTEPVERFRRIRVSAGPELGIFRERQLLQTAGFHAVKHAPGSIYVHAAERDDVADDAAKSIHELLRLTAGAENEIDDYIKFLPPEFRLMVLEKLAIAKNFFSANRRDGFAAMKDGDVMSCLLQSFDGRWSDETRAADEKDFHNCRTRMIENRNRPVYCCGHLIKICSG